MIALSLSLTIAGALAAFCAFWLKGRGSSHADNTAKIALVLTVAGFWIAGVS